MEIAPRHLQVNIFQKPEARQFIQWIAPLGRYAVSSIVTLTSEQVDEFELLRRLSALHCKEDSEGFHMSREDAELGKHVCHCRPHAVSAVVVGDDTAAQT